MKTKEQRAAPGDTQDLSLSHPWCTHGVSIEVGGRDRTKVMADGATRVCWRTVGDECMRADHSLSSQSTCSDCFSRAASSKVHIRAGLIRRARTSMPRSHLLQHAVTFILEKVMGPSWARDDERREIGR